MVYQIMIILSAEEELPLGIATKYEIMNGDKYSKTKGSFGAGNDQVALAGRTVPFLGKEVKGKSWLIRRGNVC